jgi:RNA polymerase sigma-70 factor, ECF subfamily
VRTSHLNNRLVDVSSADQSDISAKGVLISDCLGDNVVTIRQTHKKMTTTTQTNEQDKMARELSVDHKLVVRVQNGDKTAFDLLVIKYQNKVAAVVSRYVSDYHEVADVTQEAFIKAYRAIDRFRGDSAFYTWVYRIAINCAKNYLQSKGRRPPASDYDVDDAELNPNATGLKDIASPEKLLRKEQLEQVIKQTVSRLPEDLRVALTLREFDNLSYDEIAVVMECPVGTVRSRIFRAREAVDSAISAMRGV